MFKKYLEDSVVKDDHDEARNVEGPKGAPDDEVGVVKSTNQWLLW